MADSRSGIGFIRTIPQYSSLTILIVNPLNTIQYEKILTY